MPAFEEDEDLFIEYQRYVRSTSGIPDDYDTWVQSEYGESKKRSRKQQKNGNSKFYDY
jgi:hypothetical protein